MKILKKRNTRWFYTGDVWSEAFIRLSGENSVEKAV
jgi:hypothetical protein